MRPATPPASSADKAGADVDGRGAIASALDHGVSVDRRSSAFPAQMRCPGLLLATRLGQCAACAGDILPPRFRVSLDLLVEKPLIGPSSMPPSPVHWSSRDKLPYSVCSVGEPFSSLPFTDAAISRRRHFSCTERCHVRVAFLGTQVEVTFCNLPQPCIPPSTHNSDAR